MIEDERRFQEALGKESRASLPAKDHPLHLDDRRLLDHVVGVGGTPESFLRGGFTTSVAIRALLRLVGHPIRTFETILDFGCGPGRVMHWFRDLVPDATLTGTDIDHAAIAWARNNIEMDARFLVNEHLPPLPLAEESVDLVYAISVFSHLDADYQFQWLRELHRITRPGGLLLLTVHGEEKARMDLSERELASFLQDGFLHKVAGDDATVAGLPDFYQVAYHSEAFITDRWGALFDPLLFVRHGPFRTQVAVLLQKPADDEGAEGSRPSAPQLSLPVARIGLPAAGTVVRGASVGVSGWSFYWDRTDSVDLTIWIDGMGVARCTTGAEIPLVDPPPPPHPNVAGSGFAAKIQIAGLDAGSHALWLTAPGSNVPVTTTYFGVDRSTR